MNGKGKCKILKDIRRQIAKENDIEYVTSECKYQGDCSGTCPKCEAEVRYLEEELRKRRSTGKAVAVAGIAAALVVSSAGCRGIGLGETGGDPLPGTEYTESSTSELDGEIAIDDAFMGDMVIEQESTETIDDNCDESVPEE